MPPIQLAERLALLLALAFFLGLAFEEVYKRDEPAIPGGVRTFPLVALAGALLYLVEPHHALAYCVGLLALAAWLSIFLRVDRPQPGTSRTLVIPATNLLVYALGPVALTEPVWVAIGATVAAVLLVGRREEMHGFARLVPPDEILTAGKFLILAGIILPLIPDIRLIPAAPLTPYRVWLAVVAISGLSYLTYLVQRYLPVKGGACSRRCSAAPIRRPRRPSFSPSASARPPHRAPNCRPGSSPRPWSCICGWRSSSPCSAGRWPRAWRRRSPCCSPPPGSWLGGNGAGLSAATAAGSGDPRRQPAAIDDGTGFCRALCCDLAGDGLG